MRGNVSGMVCLSTVETLALGVTRAAEAITGLSIRKGEDCGK